MSIEGELLAQMLASAEVDVELDAKAREVAEYAKGLAPVFGETGHDEKRADPPEGAPGDYRDSIHVTLAPKKPHARRIITDDYKAVWIEMGSRHMPEYAVFAKTAAYFGGTGPDGVHETVQHAQRHLRNEVEKLAKFAAEGAAAERITAQKRSVSEAREARSAAYRAARPRRRGRGR